MLQRLDIPFKVNYADAKKSPQVIIRIKVLHVTMRVISTWPPVVPAKLYTKPPESCEMLDLEEILNKMKHT